MFSFSLIWLFMIYTIFMQTHIWEPSETMKHNDFFFKTSWYSHSNNKIYLKFVIFMLQRKAKGNSMITNIRKRRLEYLFIFRMVEKFNIIEVEKALHTTLGFCIQAWLTIMQNEDILSNWYRYVAILRNNKKF